MDWISVLLVGVILIGLTAGIAFYTYRKNNPKGKKGTGPEAGAGKAVGAVKRWALSNDFKVIAPARLSGKGKFAGLDALVVGYFGILGVKAYGYNGEVYGDPKEPTWLHVAGDGERTRFENPVLEAAADVRVIRDALFAANMKGNIPVEVVCVFTDKKAQLAIPKSVSYLTMKTLKEYLDKEKFRADTGLNLEKAEAAMMAALVKE